MPLRPGPSATETRLADHERTADRASAAQRVYSPKDSQPVPNSVVEAVADDLEPV